MAARKILPIAEPDITSYAHFAFFLSVLYTDTDALRWVYSNFIPLSMKDFSGSKWVDYYTQTPYDHLVPSLIGSVHLTRKMILRQSPSFADFVRNSIEDGYYVSTNVDEFYIPGTAAYQNRSNLHGLFIHGYDDESRKFHVTGFLANQRYGGTVVDYEAMEQAFRELEPEDDYHFTVYTHLFKLNPKHKPNYDFKVPWVMEQLEDYWLAKPSDRRMQAFEERQTATCLWGMDIYDGLILQIERHIDKEAILDHRPFHVLWEHKRMMNRRLAYMEQKGFYVCSPEAAEGFRNVEKSALVNRNLILKYWMSSDNRNLEQLAERLGRLKSEESLVIERLLNEYEDSLRAGD
ncbi:hypothetical protein ACFPPD_10680 [Cohnella suwonensis]|uniref:Uncharacterized protein n=1 Tax=Cohnella suwonensis TaxID=696072 RepID=A0ABW0LTG8_9BACL